MKTTEEFKDEFPKTYKEIRSAELRKQQSNKADTECSHRCWIKKCSFCSVIMESDSQVNYKCGEDVKTEFSVLTGIVTNFNVSEKLQNRRIGQRTKLYWVYSPVNDEIGLRCYENVSIQHTQIIAAYSSSELVAKLRRLPVEIMTDEVYLYIGQNAFDPNRLARLYLKLTAVQ